MIISRYIAGVSHQIFALVIDANNTLFLYVKPCGKLLEEEWKKCLELKCKTFRKGSKANIEISGFDGPNFLLKQDNNIYWITLQNSSDPLKFQALHFPRSNTEKSKVVFSGFMDSEHFTVFSTDNNHFSTLKISPYSSDTNCGYEEMPRFIVTKSEEIHLPPNSFSSICTCLKYCKLGNDTGMTGVFGTLQKEILFFQKEVITRTIKLASVPVSINIIQFNAYPVVEQYLVVHTQDRKAIIYSLVDFTNVKGS